MLEQLIYQLNFLTQEDLLKLKHEILKLEARHTQKNPPSPAGIRGHSEEKV